MTVVMLQLPAISAGDVELMDIAVDKYLIDSEVISGTPTAVEQTSSDLTIGTVTVNTGATKTVLGTSRAIGTVISIPVQGQKVATGSYAVLVTFATDASRTKKVLAKFSVDPGV